MQVSSNFHIDDVSGVAADVVECDADDCARSMQRMSF
jgi:hypothetical protein